MLASVVHVLPLTVVRRERVLTMPGHVLVRQGQKVAPQDVIAESPLAPEHMTLNVPRSLGVSSIQAKSLIQRSVGDEVKEGDLIAGPVGITRRVLRAPADGRIVLIREGRVLLEMQTQPFRLRAGLVGMVTDLIADYGAVIEAEGALIQGVWGNGRMDFGLLQSKLAAPDEKLTPDQLDVSLRGAVVLAGHCDQPKALHNAADIPLKGLILSSMAAALVPLAAKLPIPVIVLNGFGERPLDTDSFKLLSTNQNRDVSVNAAPFNRHTGTRPELVIPLPSGGSTKPPVETEDYAIGHNVRLCRAPQAGAIGTIEHIYQSPIALPSGVRALAATVKLENGTSLNLPLANLEVLT